MVSFADRLPPSLRGLLRQKRFAALAVASLGVAIALNTTMYSVTDAIVFPEVAMRQPKNLYRLPFYGDGKGRIPVQTMLDTYTGMSFFEDIAFRAGNYGRANMAERGTASRTTRVYNVSSNYFALLGVKALAGRLLTDADANAPERPVVVSERFWLQMFPDVKTFEPTTFLLDGEPRTVVGTLAYESDFPGELTDIWQLPLGNATNRQSSIRVFNVVRLKSNLTIEDAFVELNATAAKLATSIGEKPTDARFDLLPMINGPLRIAGFHLSIIGAVLFVLLVACFNLANLQLARGLSRTRELATRAAVGATRRNLVMLLVGESTWIAAAGVVLGVILTFWGMALIRTQVPPTLEAFLVRPQVSWRLFAFATTTGALALSIVGLFPAIKVSRVDVNELLKAGAGTGASRKTRWQAGALVVFQVGLAMALVVSATLLVRSAATLYQLDVNPILEHIATARIALRPSGADDRRSVAAVSNELVSRAKAIPGVVEAATSRSVSPDHYAISISKDGDLPREIQTGLRWSYRIVSDAYSRTYGFSMLKGRDFSPGEASNSVLIDEQTARYLWPGNDPIGRQIKFGSAARRDEGWMTVVGVVEYKNVWGSFRTANQAERLEPELGIVMVLSAADTAHAYAGVTGQGRMRTTQLEVSVRGAGSIERLPMLMRRAFGDPGAGFLVSSSDRLSAVLSLDLARERQDFVAGLFTAFALLALGLASLGVYAVVSHTVSQRTREIGVRVALGATQQHIRQGVLHHGNVLALLGIVVGLLLSWGIAPLLGPFLFAGGGWDYWSFPVGAATMFAAAFLASYVPARRAMRVNPVEALRAE